MNRYEIQKYLGSYGDDRQAAQKFLAAVIHDVWKKRGTDVKVGVVDVSDRRSQPIYELKSSTLNGKPL